MALTLAITAEIPVLYTATHVLGTSASHIISLCTFNIQVSSEQGGVEAVCVTT